MTVCNEHYIKNHILLKLCTLPFKLSIYSRITVKPLKWLFMSFITHIIMQNLNHKHNYMEWTTRILLSYKCRISLSRRFILIKSFISLCLSNVVMNKDEDVFLLSATSSIQPHFEKNICNSGRSGKSLSFDKLQT